MLSARHDAQRLQNGVLLWEGSVKESPARRRRRTSALAESYMSFRLALPGRDDGLFGLTNTAESDSSPGGVGGTEGESLPPEKERCRRARLVEIPSMS